MGRSEYRPASAPAGLLGILLLLLSYTGRAWLQHLCLRSLCLNQHSALWQRTGTEHNVFSLCEGPWQPSTPMSRGAREEAVLLRTSSSGCQIFPPPFGKPVPCTMLICHSKWLTWLLLLYERLFFFDCLFFCWFYFAPVLQRKAKSAWISRVTICRMTAAFYHMFIAYMACGGAGEVLHDGIWGGSSVV